MIIHVKIHLIYFSTMLKIYYCFLINFIKTMLLNFFNPIPNFGDFISIPIFWDILSYCFYIHYYLFFKHRMLHLSQIIYKIAQIKI